VAHHRKELKVKTFLLTILLMLLPGVATAQTGGAVNLRHGTLAERPATCQTSRGEVYFQIDAAGEGVGTYDCPANAWRKLGSDVASQGTLAARPAAAMSNKSRFYFATDTGGGTLYVSTGAAWVKIGLGLGEGGVADHGGLTGLSDNDHPQYQLRSEQNQSGGYAGLDGSGLMPDARLPAGVARDAEVSSAVAAEASSRDAAIVAASAADRDRANHTGTQSADTLVDGTTNKAYTATERTKLAGVAAGATANSSDAFLLSRSNHTGSQAISTVTGLQTAIDSKQAADSDLTAIAALAPADGDVIQRSAGAWVNRTLAQLKTSLAFTTSDVLEGVNLYFTNARADARVAAAVGVSVQAFDSDLSTFAGLSPATNDLLQFKSGAWANRTPAQVKTDLAISAGDVAGLGTAATRDVPASGNASSLQVVLATDTRLADARTPTAHASTHSAAGSDPVTLSESQVSGLTSDLTGKQAADTDLTAVAGLSSTGLVARTGAGTAAVRTLSAGSSKVLILNGDGVAGNPSVDVTEANVSRNSLGGGALTIANGGTGQTTASAAFDALSPNTTLGDVAYRGASSNVRLAGNTSTTKKYLAQTGDGSASAAPAWSQPAFSELSGTATVAQGGTGQTTYTNGQLLIGNTTGNTLTKATLTQGTGIAVTNGVGSITIANAGVTSITGTTNQVTASASTGGVTLSLPQSIATTSTPTFGALALGTGTTDATRVFDLAVASSSDLLARFWNSSTAGFKLRFVSGTGGTAQHQWTDDTAWLASIAVNNTLGFSFRVRKSADANSEAGLDAAEAMRIDRGRNVIVGQGALSTSAADGFLYIPTTPGTPTGTPTPYTGRVPLVWDSANNKLCIYSVGAWRCAAF
jgi:hypothetical protein